MENNYHPSLHSAKYYKTMRVVFKQKTLLFLSSYMSPGQISDRERIDKARPVRKSSMNASSFLHYKFRKHVTQILHPRCVEMIRNRHMSQM